MNLSNLIGKQILAVYEGEIVGTVCGATFNYNLTKIKSLKVFDNNENDYEINYSNIKAVGEYVVIANTQKLEQFNPTNKTLPIYKTVININGNNLGKIIDAEIEINGTVKCYLSDKQEQILPAHITIRKDFVFYSENKLVLKNFKPKNVSPKNIVVSILEKPNYNQNFAPTKITYNATTLLGKIAKSDLFGINNEIIIKANSVITEKTIADASRHNRLNQLYYLAI